VKAELIQGQRLAVDEEGAVLVWTGDTASVVAPTAPAPVQAQRGLAHTRHHKMRGAEARALWLLSEIARHHDPPDVAQAEAHYQQSLALAEDLGMRPLQAHCHLGLGTLYAKTGQWAQARAALSTAIDLYRAMAMLFWLPQVEVALAQVEGQ
jgi:uncharacterized protein HemY